MIWLFKVTPISTYGLIGTIFAVLYLLVDLLDLGFDGSLAIDFKLLSASKLNFRKIFLRQQLGQLLILGLVSLGMIFGHRLLNSWFMAKFSCCAITPAVWLTLGLLLVFEGLLKDLRALAQLFFLSKVLAIAQVLSITIYTSIILCNYYFSSYYLYLDRANYFALNLNLIFAPLLLSSILSLILLSWAIYQRYQALPDYNLTDISVAPELHEIQIPETSKLISETFTFKTLIVQRFWIFLNQLSKLAFSGNFLITLLASLFGTATVAPLKLTSRIAVYLRYVLYHSLGLPIRSLLSQTQAQLTFRNYRNILKQFFYTFTGILASAGVILISLTILNTESLVILMRENSLIFLGILLLDNLFLAHEQYLLVANKIYYFALPNLITISLIYGLVNSYHPTLNSLLLSLAALRIGTFILINLVVIKKFVEKTPQSL
jgi:hypothetical protein